MKAQFNHLQINVSNVKKSFEFYRAMLAHLGWELIYEEEEILAFGDGKISLWLVETKKEFKKKKYHRKYTGINHLAFAVGSRKEVDDFCKRFLEKRKIKPLYESPKYFPEYGKDYYVVYFEDPDRIKLEVLHS